MWLESRGQGTKYLLVRISECAESGQPGWLAHSWSEIDKKDLILFWKQCNTSLLVSNGMSSFGLCCFFLEPVTMFNVDEWNSFSYRTSSNISPTKFNQVHVVP